MAVQQHAIAPGARRAGFWPSIAVAAAQLRRQQLSQIGQGQPGDPAVFPGSPRPTARHDVHREVCDESVRKAPVAAGARVHRCSTAVARASRRAQWVCSCVASCCRARAGLARDARGRRRPLRPQGERTGERGREQRTALGGRVAQDHSSWGDIVHRRQDEAGRVQRERGGTRLERRRPQRDTQRRTLGRGRRHRRLGPVRRKRRRLRRRRRRVVCHFRRHSGRVPDDRRRRDGHRGVCRKQWRECRTRRR